MGKKILLSLGGGSGGYALESDDDATNLANFLWGAFGPKGEVSGYTGPRPFDIDSSNGYPDEPSQVDGFDFDIENVNGVARTGPCLCRQLNLDSLC